MAYQFFRYHCMFKACASNFCVFYQNEVLEKLWKMFVLPKKLFFSQIFNVLFFPAPLFWFHRRSRLKLNIRYMTLWLAKQEFKNKKLFNIFRSQEGPICKLGQLINYCIRKIFIESYTANIPQKLVPDLYLMLVNSLKYSQRRIEKTFLLKKHFCK